MMRKVVFITFLLFYCVASSAQTSQSKIDSRFVGTWSGSENGQQREGLQKHWVQHRFADGNFILLFTTISEDGEVESFAEKGKWWIEDGNFHELHFVSGETDVYSYQFLDDDHVRFKAKKIIESADGNYEFSDERVPEY